MAPNPPIIDAKITLSCPLYACDFDPSDPNRLFVGGGGGAGRSGVGNKITLLDVSHPESVEFSAEIDLSRDEDNVTSLAAGPRRGKATVVFAGINSNPEKAGKGKNEHFRVFTVDQRPSSAGGKTKATDAISRPKIFEISRSSLFSSSDADTYQRLLRLSAPFEGSHQLGAVATGLAKDAQIAIFDASAAAGATGIPKSKGRLDLDTEAQDLDIIQTGDDTYQLAYCAGFDLSVTNISKGKSEGSLLAYSVPDDVNDAPKPSFRSIRYLTPDFLLSAMNLPKRTGVLLHGLRLQYPERVKARLAISAMLPRSVAAATCLAVRNLSPASSPSVKQGDTQFVIAVAGLDSSISLYTLELQSLQGIDVLVKLYPFRTLRTVHPMQITSMAFSAFQTPKTTTARLQHVRLASTSVANTVAVHNIPLKKLFDRPAEAAKRGPQQPPRQPRYVVAIESKGPSMVGLFVAMAIIVAFVATVAQTWLELRGLAPPVLGAERWTPVSWHGSLRHPQAAASLLSAQPSGPSMSPPFLAQILAEKNLQGSDRIILREGDDPAAVAAAGAGTEAPLPIEVTQHDEAEHGPGLRWEDLTREQKQAWKERLKAAGHWSNEMGDSVFKGVLFSELAGIAGAAVRG